MKVELIDRLDDLRQREGEWWALHRRLPSASLFASPAWVLNWIDSFATAFPLRCVFVSDKAGLAAVFPLVQVRTRWRRMPVAALTACTNAHSVRSALLFDPLRGPAAWAAAFSALREIGGWDMLLFDGCDGPGHPGQLPEIRGELPVARWQHSCLKVQGSWDNYLAGCSRDLRRNLRRTEADLRRLGKLDFHLLEHDANDLFDRWVQVDRASWKASHGESVDHCAQTRGFYQGMLRNFAAHRQMLGGVLSLDGQPIAVLVCALDSQRGVCYTLKTGIRQNLSSARLSLGALVMDRLLAALWAKSDVRLIDFVSKQSYTERWANEVLSFERRVAFASSWRGQAAALLDRAFQHAVAQRERIVETTGR